jgi:hypothetical protein
MATEIDAAILAITVALENTKPALEGFEDDNRLNIQDATRVEVQVDIARYTTRVGLLETALKALEDLNADDFPELPAREIPASAYDDLKEQKRTIDAAFSKYLPKSEAEVLKATVGTPVPK